MARGRVALSFRFPRQTMDCLGKLYDESSQLYIPTSDSVIGIIKKTAGIGFTYLLVSYALVFHWQRDERSAWE